MRSVEVSARKREDAINKALNELGIERHEAHVEILDEGSPGFLGIGVRDVTVRVSTDVPGEGGFPIEADGNRVDAERRQARNERGRGAAAEGGRRGQRRDHRNGDRGPRAQQRDRSGDRPNRDRRDRPDRPSRPAQQSGGRPDRPSRPVQQGGGRPDRPARPAQQGGGRPDRPARPAQQGGGRPDRPARPAQQGGGRRSGRPDRPKRPREERPREERPREERPRPEPKERPPAKILTDARSNEAAALLNEIIEHMGIESKVQPVESVQGGLTLSVESPDSALLIGRKGRNLTAMQYLINRIFNRQDEWQQTERIIVDVEGYLDRRRDTLEDMALRMAERAKASGRRVRVKPLSPQERRIVHLALHDDPDVRTFSVGESNYRSVIIAPVTEGDTDEEDDDRDYRDDYEESGAGAEKDSLDDSGDDMFDDEFDNGDEESSEDKSPQQKPASENPPADSREPAIPEDAGDSADEEEEDDADSDSADSGGAGDPKRFRTRRAIGRRGAIRKRRPPKHLASVSADGDKSSAGEAKEDASRVSDNA